MKPADFHRICTAAGMLDYAEGQGPIYPTVDELCRHIAHLVRIEGEHAEHQARLSEGGRITAAKMSKAQRTDRARKGGLAKAAKRAAQMAESEVAQAEHRMEGDR
jgi:hypothetical protein